MNTYRSLSQLVGHTPLLEAGRYRELAELPANLFLKLESFNPAGGGGGPRAPGAPPPHSPRPTGTSPTYAPPLSINALSS